VKNSGSKHKSEESDGGTACDTRTRSWGSYTEGVNQGYISHIVFLSFPWAIKGGRGLLKRGCPFCIVKVYPVLVGRFRREEKLRAAEAMTARSYPGPPPPLSPLPPHVSVCRAREAASVRGMPVCFQRSSILLPASSSRMPMVTWVRGTFLFAVPAMLGSLRCETESAPVCTATGSIGPNEVGSPNPIYS
jgi:hypothetical protein